VAAIVNAAITTAIVIAVVITVIPNNNETMIYPSMISMGMM
jgi:hypothetical protein